MLDADHGPSQDGAAFSVNESGDEMPTTVYSASQSGAATRALVIGVGHYPALPGGGGPPMARPEGMSQLQSPPFSARAFARWMIEDYHSPSRPLASVHLLVSEPTAQDFSYTKDGKSHTAVPLPADIATVRNAIRQWQAMSTSLDDLMVFYFCGHGISNPAKTALLMSDFGSVAAAPLDGALDFTGFKLGMEDTTARNQCFFIDACRLGSTLLQRNNYAGDPVLHAHLMGNPGDLPRIGPQFFSTLAGEAAYGRPGHASVFTEALIDALSGPAASRVNGEDWVVNTGQLQTALGFLIKESIRANGWAVDQQPIVDAMQELALNNLKEDPKVPVLVNVDPGDAHAEALLRYKGKNGLQDQRDADPAPWSLRLPVGEYSFYADFESARYGNAAITDTYISPPYQERKLKAAVP